MNDSVREVAAHSGQWTLVAGSVVEILWGNKHEFETRGDNVKQNFVNVPVSLFY
jgi:hypothetical protein